MPVARRELFCALGCKAGYRVRQCVEQAKPITWLACSIVGTASPRSDAALRMQPAIIDVESTIVPSQSNTIRSKRRT